MNQNNKKYLVLALAALPLLNSCSDSWLDPHTSFFHSKQALQIINESRYLFILPKTPM